MNDTVITQAMRVRSARNRSLRIRRGRRAPRLRLPEQHEAAQLQRAPRGPAVQTAGRLVITGCCCDCSTPPACSIVTATTAPAGTGTASGTTARPRRPRRGRPGRALLDHPGLVGVRVRALEAEDDQVALLRLRVDHEDAVGAVERDPPASGLASTSPTSSDRCCCAWRSSTCCERSAAQKASASAAIPAATVAVAATGSAQRRRGARPPSAARGARRRGCALGAPARARARRCRRRARPTPPGTRPRSQRAPGKAPGARRRPRARRRRGRRAYAALRSWISARSMSLPRVRPPRAVPGGWPGRRTSGSGSFERLAEAVGELGLRKPP